MPCTSSATIIIITLPRTYTPPIVPSPSSIMFLSILPLFSHPQLLFPFSPTLHPFLVYVKNPIPVCAPALAVAFPKPAPHLNKRSVHVTNKHITFFFCFFFWRGRFPYSHAMQITFQLKKRQSHPAQPHARVSSYEPQNLHQWRMVLEYIRIVWWSIACIAYASVSKRRMPKEMCSQSHFSGEDLKKVLEIHISHLN